ncbi:response regulator transcription factor [Actinomyces vulturis]|uniref:response regulator transcription factor n=1 Tax=Actinomyces vulturis TaxID=1857645 RepID=UPI000836675A|nr:response regulator transcription factor [Actinomyces vulturis]
METFTPARLVVVEDDHDIASAIAARFNAVGWHVMVVGDGLSAWNYVTTYGADALIIDLMLPVMDGMELCSRLRDPHKWVEAGAPASMSNVPVLMLTARDDEADVLAGLARGADDYMTKPFSMRELVARVTALLRRHERAQKLAQEVVQAQDETLPPHDFLTLGDIDVDITSRRVTRQGQDIHVTPTEFDLLVRLARSPGEVFSRERLLEDVWGWADPSVAATRTVDSHVKALRRKLGSEVIRTVHGVGYAFSDSLVSNER